MKPCPVCSKSIDTIKEKICSQCGWEFPSVSNQKSDASFIQKKLGIAKRNWQALLTLLAQVKLLNHEVTSLQDKVRHVSDELSVNAIPEDISQTDLSDDIRDQAIQDITIPPIPENLLKNDEESIEDYQNRILAIDSYQIGTVQLIQEKYNIESGLFPIELQFEPWANNLLGMPPENAEFFIVVEREKAKEIYTLGPIQPLYAMFKFSNGELASDSFYIQFNEEKVVIRMTWKEPVLGMELVWVFGGDYKMGSPQDEPGRYENESPYHDVRLDSFWIGKFPVIQWEWKLLMRENPRPSPTRDRLPIVKVSWHEAKQFLQKLTDKSQDRIVFQLPTEAEWEYVCRAGTTTPYFFGDQVQDNQANFGGKHKGLTPVEKFSANAFGIYDLHGNVWEWCEDIYSDTAYQNHVPVNPVYLGDSSSDKKPSPKTNRIIRGGCFYRAMEYMRSAYRYGYSAELQSGTIGFRVVMKT